MRKHVVATMIAGMLALAIPPTVFGQTPSPAKSSQPKSKKFDPRDLSGVWWVSDPGPEKLLARGTKGDASKCETCHIPEHTMPEPPLTPWAKENLLVKNEMSKGMSAAPADPAAAHTAVSKRYECDPIGVPAQFWYTQLSPFENLVNPDRIIQFFEAQHEWRTIWMNRDHPERPDPTYMGDSIGKWDGDTLVVDTIGYNGKDLIEPVGVDHLMSDAFHLVERWRRTSPTTMELDLTYYDPKAWGDKSWGGLTKKFISQPNMQIEESFCSKKDNAAFDELLLNPSKKSGQ